MNPSAVLGSNLIEQEESSPIDHSKGNVPFTFYDDIERQFNMGVKGSSTILINKQGLKLKTYFWPAQNAKCVLIFVHGHGAHLQFELLKNTGPNKPSSYANSWAEQINKSGISICGIDNQGCGLSEGIHRFYTESFSSYVDDVLQLAQLLNTPSSDTNIHNKNTVPREGFSNLPLFIAGISLGGCIAYTAALQQPDIFKGIALLAPMLSLEKVARKGLNPYMRPIATLLSHIIPSAAIVATDKNHLYPDIQALWDSDPLCCHTNTRVRNANEYLIATEAAMASLEQMKLPLIIFHSENDTMCDCSGSKQLYLRAQSEDKALRLVNHMWHVLVKEKGNEKICGDIIEWILKRI